MKLNTKRIKNYLAEKDMSLAELARACNMYSAGITTVLKRGTCTPRIAGRIARGMGVDLSEITLED